MMLDDLRIVLAQVPASAPVAAYGQAIVDENILNKPTYSSRLKSSRHLLDLYGLDTTKPLFRVLRALAGQEPESLPQLAMICCFCREPQLRESFRLIERLRPGYELAREEMENHLEAAFPARYSPAMKKSLAKNVNTTWTDSDHLKGRNKKIRLSPKPTLAGTVYAMFAGYLYGLRGTLLVNSVFSTLVGAEPTQAISLLQAGSSRGWCRVRHAGDVLQIDFSPMLTPHEQELAHGAA